MRRMRFKWKDFKTFTNEGVSFLAFIFLANFTTATKSSHTILKGFGTALVQISGQKTNQWQLVHQWQQTFLIITSIGVLSYRFNVPFRLLPFSLSVDSLYVCLSVRPAHISPASSFFLAKQSGHFSIHRAHQVWLCPTHRNSSSGHLHHQPSTKKERKVTTGMVHLSGVVCVCVMKIIRQLVKSTHTHTDTF